MASHVAGSLSRDVSIENTKGRQSSRIGNYVYFTPPIGRGSFSKVFLGHRIDAKEPVSYVAIKRVSVSNMKKMSIQRLKREIDILKALDHPNIVKFYDTFIDIAYNIYIVTEYCNYGDLSQFTFFRNKMTVNISSTSPVIGPTKIKMSKKSGIPNRSLTHEEIKTYTIQLRNGLRYLLEHSVVHRDIKPQNILLHKNSDETIVLKIADFGFAKDFATLTEESMMETLCGTPMYMSPEMVRTRKYNLYSDLWSIGVIIYQLFFHDVPFPKPNNVLELIRSLDAMKLTFPEQIDPNARDLLTQLLEVDPLKRCRWGNFFSHAWFGKAEYIDPGTSITNLTKSLASDTESYLEQKIKDEELLSSIQEKIVHKLNIPPPAIGGNTLDASSITHLKDIFHKHEEDDNDDIPYSSKLFCSPTIREEYFPLIPCSSSAPSEQKVRISVPSQSRYISTHIVPPPEYEDSENFQVRGSKPIPIPSKRIPSRTMEDISRNGEIIHEVKLNGSSSSDIWNKSGEVAKYVGQSIGSSLTYLGHTLSPFISKFSQ